jgi:hypothetical protein
MKLHLTKRYLAACVCLLTIPIAVYLVTTYVSNRPPWGVSGNTSSGRDFAKAKGASVVSPASKGRPKKANSEMDAKRNFETVRRLVAEFDGSYEKTQIISQAIERTASEENFDDLLSLIMTLSPGTFRTGLLGVMVDSMSRGPMTAQRVGSYIDRANALDLPEEKKVLLGGLEHIFLRTKFDDLVILSAKYGNSKSITSRINATLGAQLAARTPIGNIGSVAQSINLSEERKMVVTKKAMLHRAMIYPKEAIEFWKKTGIPDDPVILCNVARGLVNANPKEAADWVTTQSYSKKFTESIETIFSSWMVTSSMDCSKYVQQMPTGPAKDIASIQIGERLLALGEKESAEAWLGRSIKVK